ncbi:MAG TPA: DnaJ C-terminal domain-containing protein [Pirellulales bacterium]|jgi:DnaJ-class molecular chaperone|nr:DnaJ C-terminal domain-containing protein [Pirellulales bacterium]
MADDYYETLGVAKNASQADIQKAYRTLARKYHPDLNPNDKTAKEKFQKVQAAFDVLNDTSKRELYDRYGSAFEQTGTGAGAGPHARQAWQAQQRPGGFEEIDLGDLFGQGFGGSGGSGGSPFADLLGGFRRGAQAGGKGRRGKPIEQPGPDVESEIEIPFQTAIQGGKVEVGVQRSAGKTDRIEVKIPAGIRDGAKIRLRGQGGAGEGNALAGDLLLTVHVATHAYFQRRGNDLIVRVPITLTEAVAGAKVDVPTPNGAISLRIPPRTSGGARLRVRGHGVKLKNGTTGDLYAEVQIVLPPVIDDATVEMIRKLDQEHPTNPRHELRW